MTWDFKKNLELVKTQINEVSRACNKPNPVLIAVSKTHPVDAIEALYHLGQRDFGENYAQELAEKAPVLSQRGYKDIRWHFIGHLQSNKIKLIAPWVCAIHSVDRVELAKKIRTATASTPEREISIFLEVNIDHEKSKSGFLPEEVLKAAQELGQVQGLMCIPDPTRSDSGAPFKALLDLSNTLGKHTQGSLSMGMTQDYKYAIQNGSTHIRVGTALFGSRNTRK